MNGMTNIDPDSYQLPNELIKNLLTPALIVFLDKSRHNIQRVIEHADGVADRWRPHLKTTKMPQIWDQLLDAGVRNFKCATTREAACLIGLLKHRNIKDADLLIAYPLIGPGLLRAGEIANSFNQCKVSVLCEDPQAIASIPDSLSIFIDINPRMNRTGIDMADRSAIINVAQAAGERLRGLHCYDGHISNKDPNVRRNEAWQIYDSLLEITSELKAQSVKVGELITSGTRTFLDALSFEPFRKLNETVHRISPGTVVFGDIMTQTTVPEADLQPAVIVASRVVSRPAGNIATCDAGSKAIAAEAGDPCASVIGHDELVAIKPSEEHLPFLIESGVGPKRGEVLLLVPKHVCPTVNLAQQAVLVENGKVYEIVDVAAAGHELEVCHAIVR